MTETNSPPDLRADPDLDLETPRRLELIDPLTEESIKDDTGKPAYLMIYSAQSRTFRERAHKITARYKQMAKRQPKGELTFEQEEQAKAEVYAAAIADEWHLCRKQNGVWKALVVPCTQEMTRLWIDQNPLYKAQLEAKTDDIREFMESDGVNFTSEASSNSTKASKTR